RVLYEQAQCGLVEDDAIEIERLETLARIRVLALRDRVVPRQTPHHHRQRRATVRYDELQARVAKQMAGVEEARYGNRRVGDPAESIDQVVVGQPGFTAEKHRVDEDGCA